MVVVVLLFVVRGRGGGAQEQKKVMGTVHVKTIHPSDSCMHVCTHLGPGPRAAAAVGGRWLLERRLVLFRDAEVVLVGRADLFVGR